MIATYDSELLRTLVSVSDSGTFAKAAARLRLTQSTISQQMKRLEEQAEQPLFAPSGRSRVLTDSGEVLLGYARKILALNESATVAMRHGARGGVVRIGVVQDFADTRLPHALRTFARRRPEVRVEAQIGRSRDLSARLEDGLLDLAIVFDEPRMPRGTIIRRLRLAWLAANDFTVPSNGEPWPLVLFDGVCTFREKAIATLDERRVPWRIVYTSPSLSGLNAAVRAGIGVTVRTSEQARNGIRVLGGRGGLPELGKAGLKMLTSSETLPHPAEELVLSLRAACALRAAA